MSGTAVLEVEKGQNDESALRRNVRRFPPAPKYADEDMCFAARLQRLKKQVQGTEPFEFDAVMEHVYSPGPDLMFTDNSIVEHAGKVWNFHVVGNPEDLEKADPRIRKLKYEYNGYAIGNTLFDFEYQAPPAPLPSGGGWGGWANMFFANCRVWGSPVPKETALNAKLGRVPASA